MASASALGVLIGGSGKNFLCKNAAVGREAERLYGKGERM